LIDIHPALRPQHRVRWAAVSGAFSTLGALPIDFSDCSSNVCQVDKSATTAAKSAVRDSASPATSCAQMTEKRLRKLLPLHEDRFHVRLDEVSEPHGA
jgi:hypothetical protein